MTCLCVHSAAVDVAGKFESTTAISSPCPMRARQANNAGVVFGSIPISIFFLNSSVSLCPARRVRQAGLVKSTFRQRHPVCHRNIGMLELRHHRAEVIHVFDVLLVQKVLRDQSGWYDNAGTWVFSSQQHRQRPD